MLRATTASNELRRLSGASTEDADMAKGVRAAVAAAALGMGLLGAAGAARADTYDFTFQSTSALPFFAQGTFQYDGNLKASSDVTGTVTYKGGMGDIDVSNSASTNLSSNPASIQLIFGFETNDFYSAMITANGIISNNNVLSMDANYVTENRTSQFDSAGSGIFEAMLAPSAPSSGSGSSGSAPSPEVNTLLGFLIVGGTVAFLKRRRKNGGVAEDLSAA